MHALPPHSEVTVSRQTRDETVLKSRDPSSVLHWARPPGQESMPPFLHNCHENLVPAPPRVSDVRVKERRGRNMARLQYHFQDLSLARCPLCRVRQSLDDAMVVSMAQCCCRGSLRIRTRKSLRPTYMQIRRRDLALRRHPGLTHQWPRA